MDPKSSGASRTIIMESPEQKVCRTADHCRVKSYLLALLVRALLTVRPCLRSGSEEYVGADCEQYQGEPQDLGRSRPPLWRDVEETLQEIHDLPSTSSIRRECCLLGAGQPL